MVVWIAHLWAEAVRLLAPVSAWLSNRVPPGIPRWLWAVLIVAAGYLAGHLTSRLLSGALRLAVLAAAVVVGWEVLHAGL